MFTDFRGNKQSASTGNLVTEEIQEALAPFERRLQSLELENKMLRAGARSDSTKETKE